jgi:hypothetical protein
MFTIRIIAFTTTTLALTLVLFPVQVSNYVAQTGRELDVAIVGRGFLRFEDSNSGAELYSRNGSLAIDADGRLISGESRRMLHLSPQITIPTDAERISVLQNGEVQILQDRSWVSVGTIELAIFASSPVFSDTLGFNAVPESGPHRSVPIPATPATSGSGVLQQGWKEQRDNPVTQYGVRAALAILIGFLLDRLLIRHRHCNKSDNQEMHGSDGPCST